jgi:hypothetical protein
MGGCSDQSLENRIRERAYEIWIAHGCVHGHADQHWLAAERDGRARRQTRSEKVVRIEHLNARNGGLDFSTAAAHNRDRYAHSDTLCNLLVDPPLPLCF